VEEEGQRLGGLAEGKSKEEGSMRGGWSLEAEVRLNFVEAL
jgi:hypothetical protein